MLLATGVHTHFSWALESIVSQIKMKNLNLLLLLTFLYACGTTTHKQATDEPTSTPNIDSAKSEITTKVEPQPIPETNADTIPKKLLENRRTGGYELTFIELTQEQADSLENRIISTAIPLSTPNEIITKTDSCFIVQLRNTKQDTVCNFDDGEYHETYILKGVWSEANQLLMNFENWEEQHDYLINLNDGSHYILGPEYRLSPNRKLMLSFIDMISYPIYPNEFILSEFNRDGSTEYFNIDFGEHTITSANWLTNEQLLITAGQINYETFELANETTYLLKLNKTDSNKR